MKTNETWGRFSCRDTAILRLKEFTKSSDQEMYMDDKWEGSVDQLKEINEIIARYNISLGDLRETKDIKKRNAILREIKSGSRLSIREMSRMLGISKDIIFRAQTRQ